MPYADKKVNANYHLIYMRLYRKKRGKSRSTKDMITRRNSDKVLRLKIIAHYSNGTMSCTRCGFNDIRALSIDHINGSGRKQRETLSNSRSFYNWLKTNNYPSGFQTLCMNCQFIKKKDNFECRHNLVASEPIKETK